MKYFVAEKKEINEYILREFDNLTHAYRYFLENAAGRTILREVQVSVEEVKDK